jgi:hypothetical protein
MKKILVIIGLGLSSCSSYKIEMTASTAGTFYEVYRRHNLHWDNSNSIFYSEKGALERIEEWRSYQKAVRPKVVKRIKN